MYSLEQIYILFNVSRACLKGDYMIQNLVTANSNSYKYQNTCFSLIIVHYRNMCSCCVCHICPVPHQISHRGPLKNNNNHLSVDSLHGTLIWNWLPGV